MNIYLAAQYGRREEIKRKSFELIEIGHNVQASWLEGPEQLINGEPLGRQGEALVEDDSNHSAEAIALRLELACAAYRDVMNADCLIAFTEPPGAGPSRGGRHVEFGMVLGWNCRVIVVGYRENVFYCLPLVEFYESWDDALAELRFESE